MQNFSKKQIRYYIIIPFLLSICILAFVFKLKFQETIEYSDPIFRIAFIFIGMILLTWVCISLGLYIRSKFEKLIENRIVNEKVKGILIGIFALLVMVIPLLISANELTKYNNKLEIDAINQRGIESSFVIKNAIRHRGKGSHWEFEFTALDNKKRMYQLFVKRKHNSLRVGDTIQIVYLKNNPTIFIELGKIEDKYQ